MNPFSGIAVQILSGFLLILGYFLFGWSFSHAALAYIFEIACYVLLGTIYFLFSSGRGQPGPILMGGGFIVLITLIASTFLADRINEFPHIEYGFGANLKIYLKEVVTDSWYVWILIVLGVLASFFTKNKRRRVSSYQYEVMYRILTIFSILVLNGFILYFFHSIHKIIILSSIILLRIGLEVWMTAKVKPKSA